MINLLCMEKVKWLFLFRSLVNSDWESNFRIHRHVICGKNLKKTPRNANIYRKESSVCMWKWVIKFCVSIRFYVVCDGQTQTLGPMICVLKRQKTTPKYSHFKKHERLWPFKSVHCTSQAPFYWEVSHGRIRKMSNIWTSDFWATTKSPLKETSQRVWVDRRWQSEWILDTK